MDPTAPRYGDELAVVTVTYSPGRALDTFLGSLPAATGRNVRVLLADTGSVDGAPERAAAGRADVTLLRIGENVGYGAGANRGVAELGSEVGWVVVAHPDVRWCPGSLDALLAAAARRPRAGALGPLIRDPSGAVSPPPRCPAARTAAPRTEPVECTTGWLSGACLLLRRTAFDSVNGFDPRYVMYVEDVDLGERLDRAGWQNVHVPSAEVVHAGGVSTGRPEVAARMRAERHRSAYRYLADRHPGARWAPLRAVLRAGLDIRSRLAVRSAAEIRQPTRGGVSCRTSKRSCWSAARAPGCGR